MNLLIFIVLLLLLNFSSRITAKQNPLSDEFINLINNKQTTWKAGRNFHPNTPLSSLRGLLRVYSTKEYRLPEQIHSEDDYIPERFDARKAWPACGKIIGEIRDQGKCAVSWAFGAVEAMSDRICIHSNASIQVSVSAQDLLTCCEYCGYSCFGGESIHLSWIFWNYRGIASGGGYNSSIGCIPYTVEPCNHHTNGRYKPCDPERGPYPHCRVACNANYEIPYEDDLTFGKPPYSISVSEKQIQLEILKNGPVEADFKVYEDFFNYKSGVYQHVEGNYTDNLAIKILGWGVEKETPYWLVANSWNTDWGDSGYFKILRGKNHCEIESNVVAALPSFVDSN